MTSAVETAIRAAVTKGMGLAADLNRKRMSADPAAHPFLSGIHAPMREEKTLLDLAVTGTIPAALDGRYLRIGPNPVAPDPRGYHWFVGDGMVHGIAVKDGQALWYRNRWIRSTSVAEALGEAPAPGPRHLHDTVNTNVVPIAGRTFALVEAGAYPIELSDDLDEQRSNPFDGTLAGAFTAHPHRDPLTGEQHAIAYAANDQEHVRHVVVSAAGKVVREAPIAVDHGPSIHDCALTRRFVIVLDLPVTLSMKAVIGGHRFPYRWNPSHKARVGLMPRDGGDADIAWCEVEPCYVFHVANAYEAEDGRVIVDVVAYDTMFDGAAKGPDSVGRLERWTIDAAARRVARHVVDTTPQEFPRIDERRFGQNHRFVYTIAVPDDVDPQFRGATRLYKHDMATGRRQVHDFGPACVPGEFVFVPAASGSAEDEGWMVGLVIDRGAEVTDLVVLDARDFEGAPVASIRIPHRIPPGFHGNWVSASSAS